MGFHHRRLSLNNQCCGFTTVTQELKLLNSVLDTVIIWCLPSRLRIWQPKNTSLLDKNKKCAPKERTKKMFPSHKLPHECSPITEWEREKTLFTKVFSRYQWQFIQFVWYIHYSTFLLFCQLLFKMITKKENLKRGSLYIYFLNLFFEHKKIFVSK